MAPGGWRGAKCLRSDAMANRSCKCWKWPRKASRWSEFRPAVPGERIRRPRLWPQQWRNRLDSKIQSIVIRPDMNSSGAMIVLQILVSVFLAILFLQSGVDKIVDRRGNTEWLTSHFSKSVFAGMVSLLLSVLT